MAEDHADGQSTDQNNAVREQFLLQIIKALKEKAAPQQLSAPSSLADTVFDKLQFDFPEVTCEELEALLRRFEECVQAKSGWFPYQLSTKFVANLLAGAKSTAESSETAAAGGGLQERFQQLAAFIHIQYTKLLLSLPQPQACELLVRYDVCEDLCTEGDAEPSLSTLSARVMDSPDSAGQSVSDDNYAAELDDDNCQYEDLDTTVATTATPVCDETIFHNPDPEDWSRLCNKLHSLSSQFDYSHVCLPRVWELGRVADGVLEIIRVLGVHSHRAELQGISEVYLSVVTDQVVACPEATPLLSRIWEALGVAAVLDARRQSTAKKLQLSAELRMMMHALANLVSRVQGSRGRAQLWQHLQQHLPVLDCCLEEVAVACSKQMQQEGLDLLLLLSELLTFFVMEAPGGAQAGRALLDSGVLRNLALLFGQHSTLPSAEQLRKAVLLAAASSPSICSWLLAVPSVKKALALPWFAEGGHSEEYGAAWQMLVEGGCSPLLAVILGRANVAEKLAAKLRLLQLLVAARRAADGRQLWGADVAVVMQNQLQEATAAMHASQNGTEPSSKDMSGSSCAVVVDTVGAEPDICDFDAPFDDPKEHGGRGKSQNSVSRQIRACVRLLKELAVRAGKSE